MKNIKGLLLIWLLLLSGLVFSDAANSFKVAQFNSKLLPDPADGGGSAGFGSLTIDGSRATISSTNLSGSGVVFVYEQVNNEWQNIAEISPADGEVGDRFGAKVILSDESLFVLSSNNKTQNSIDGSVYVFQYQNGMWAQKQKISIKNNTNDIVSIMNIFFFDSQLFITLRDEYYNSIQVRVFEFLNKNWQQVQSINPNQIDEDVNFGYSMTRIGEQLFIGAPGQNGFTGAVYIFERINDQWMEVSILAPKEVHAGAAFGASFHNNQHGLFVGAVTQNQNNETFSGAVHWLDFNQGKWEYKDTLFPSIPISYSYFGKNIESDGLNLYVSSDKYLNSNGIEDGAIHVFDLTNVDNQPEVISIDETPYKRFFANSFGVADGKMIVNAYYYRNINPKSIGKVYILNLDGLMGIEAEMIAQETAVNAKFGSQIVASGEWLMAGRKFRSENNQKWVNGIEIFKEAPDGWIKTQQISYLSEDNTVNWYAKTMDQGLAVFQKSELIDSEYINSYELYKLDDEKWVYVQTLSPYDGQEEIGFGTDIDIDQNRIVVGAPNHPPVKDVRGAIYLFEYDGSLLSPTGKVLAMDPVQYGGFGVTVALSGQFLSTSTSIRYPEGSETRGEYEVHVYKKVDGLWSYHQKIESLTDNHYELGFIMEMTPDWFLLHEYSFSHEPNKLIRVFKSIQGSWQEQNQLLPSDNISSNNFGESISIQDNVMVVKQQNNSQGKPGILGLYNYDNAEWRNVQQIKGIINSGFSEQAVLAGDGLVISAPNEYSNAISAGAVYTYDLVDDLIFYDGLD